MRLNLGCGRALLPGHINVDRHAAAGVDVVWDLNRYPWPFEDGSAELILAHHVLEHLDDLEAGMREMHRISRPGTLVDVVVPYAHTLWDVANPEHKRRFNQLTFAYFCRGFESSDLGLFQGFEMKAQALEREPDIWWGSISWIVANLHVSMAVLK